MICRVGLFTFDADSVTGLDEALRTPYAAHARAQNYPLYEPVGKNEEEITVRGNRVKADTKELTWLKEQMKLKIPLRFTTETTSIWVVVEELRTTKKTFVKNVWLFERFEVRMKRYYPSYDSRIDDIIGATL